VGQNAGTAGLNEGEIRKFFRSEIIAFFESHEFYNVESLGGELLIYRTANLATPDEIEHMIIYGKSLVDIIFREKMKTPKVRMHY
jgi:hypothetical protein